MTRAEDNTDAQQATRGTRIGRELGRPTACNLEAAGRAADGGTQLAAVGPGAAGGGALISTRRQISGEDEACGCSEKASMLAMSGEAAPKT
jgi:hypothetical protein